MTTRDLITTSTVIVATLSSLTAELSQISRSRRLEQMEEDAVTVEGSALVRRVETTSDSVVRLNSIGSRGRERDRGNGG